MNFCLFVCVWVIVKKSEMREVKKENKETLEMNQLMRYFF